MRLTVFLVAALTLLLASSAGAQTPDPDATPVSNGTIVAMTLDELAPGSVATVGMVRTTYEPGGGLRAVTGSGPSVHLVESGTISVRVDGDARVSVIPGGGDGAVAAEEPASGAEITVAHGNAYVLPAGVTAEIRNAGESPASTLDLLTASDATTDVETGVTHAVLVLREATLPGPPVTVTLSQITLAPGDQLALPVQPALAVYVTVERGQAFLLSGQGINRGTEPMEVYLLSFAPPGA